MDLEMERREASKEKGKALCCHLIDDKDIFAMGAAEAFICILS